MIRKYGKSIGIIFCGFGVVNLVGGIFKLVAGGSDLNDMVMFLISTVLWIACGTLFLLNDKKRKKEEKKLREEKKKEKTNFTTKSNKKKYN